MPSDHIVGYHSQSLLWFCELPDLPVIFVSFSFAQINSTRYNWPQEFFHFNGDHAPSLVAFLGSLPFQRKSWSSCPFSPVPRTDPLWLWRKPSVGPHSSRSHQWEYPAFLRGTWPNTANQSPAWDSCKLALDECKWAPSGCLPWVSHGEDSCLQWKIMTVTFRDKYGG